MLLILVMGVLWFGVPAVAHAASRFPQPQFESAYAKPVVQHPSGRGRIWNMVDITALTGALVLASYLALRRRSRRGMFMLTLASLAYFGFWRKGCVCPVGATQNVAMALFDPDYAVPLTALVFWVLPLLTALVSGRVFCAAVCPLGAVQDLVAMRPTRLPRWLSQALGMLPIVYLGVAVLAAAAGGSFVICRFDPFVPFFRLSGSPGILLCGLAVLVLGIVVARPYCRFLCPYGVLLNWLSRFSKWHVRITPNECVQCRLCEDACPFDAIRAPASEVELESRAQGVRRLLLLFVLIPVLMTAGAWVGRRAGPALARVNRTVRLCERVQLEDAGVFTDGTLDSDAFRASGEGVAELSAAAGAVRRRFQRGGLVLGLFLGLAFGLKLIGLSLHSRCRDYEPDRATCLSCGRCFEYCPREQQRLACRP